MEKTSSGRLIEYRKEVKKDIPVAKPFLSDANLFFKDILESWKKCRDMEKRGIRKSDIGWAFYLAMKEILKKFDH